MHPTADTRALIHINRSGRRVMPDVGQTTSGDYQRMPESIRSSLGGTSIIDTLRAAGQVTFFEGGKLQKGAATLQKYDDGWRMADETKAK